MLFSIAIMLLTGLLSGYLCKKLHLPALFGMIITGIVLGPCALNLIDETVLSISPQLRKIALVIILLRAGLALDIKDLKKVGRPAVLMCFVPACFEIAAMALLAPILLGAELSEALLIGATLAAVSPAVIVPKMIKLMEEGYGTKKSIPQLILAGASVDDVFVIVMFTAFLGLVSGSGINALSFAMIPAAIFTGVVAGLIAGYAMGLFFKYIHMRDTVKIIILVSVAFLFVTLEDAISSTVPFSGLLAVMCMGIMIKLNRNAVAVRLSAKVNKIWVCAEIMLFVLVGATVNVQYAYKAGPKAVLLIFGVLIFRMAGVFICMLGTKLNHKERFFCMIAYIPKATVQAAIGGIPLSMGLACGDMVLTVAVLGILITAPLGAFLIEIFYKKCLEQ